MLVGCFRDLVIIANKKFICDPMNLDSALINAIGKKFVYLVVMLDSVDWLVFAKWEHGKPIRLLSVSPNKGVSVDEGNKLPCEKPFWESQLNPVSDEHSEEELKPDEANKTESTQENDKLEENETKDDYPLLFHPIDLGEALLRAEFGFELAPHYNQEQSHIDKNLPAPNTIPLFAFKQNKAWWKVW